MTLLQTSPAHEALDAQKISGGGTSSSGHWSFDTQRQDVAGTLSPAHSHRDAQSTRGGGTSSSDHEDVDTQCFDVAGTLSPAHSVFDTHRPRGGGNSSHPTMSLPVPMARTSGENTSAGDQRGIGTHGAFVAGSTSVSQNTRDAHCLGADGSFSPAHRTSDTHGRLGGGAFLRDPYLALLSDSLNDLEGIRIATENRVRQLTRTEADEDGVMRGFGLDERSPEVAVAQALAAQLLDAERAATKALEKQMKRHPLYPWVEAQKGVGKKQAARLIAVIGDPYWNDLHDRPRTVSELWAWCGYSVVGGRAQQHTRGQQSNWSSEAKMRTFNIAASCVKSKGHYRDVYDVGRIKYADATHHVECKRCGPKGHPAEPGSPLSLGHQHARALRLVSKEILKDLWSLARDIHEAVA